jgi:hypothetical protein
VNAPKLPLADIHLPGEVSMWPPAYGWWILTALVTIAIYLTVKTIIKWRAQRVQRNHAVEALMKVDLEHYAAWQQINDILKRAAMVYYSRKQVAALTGENWKNFLLKCLGKKTIAFDDNWLTFAYSPSVNQATIESYHQFAQQWLKLALPVKRSKS